jgi:RHS repeat-associated protein
LIKSAYGERQTDYYDYVKQIAYDEFGQRVYIKYGNDIETRYTYDPYRRWLDNINTGNSLGGTLQNMHYTFDKVGNVLELENKAQHITQSFQYDDLYQLVRAEGTSPDKHKNKHKANHYIQTFSYDTIGNMTRKTSYNQITPGNHMPKELNFDFTYLYNGTKPHAPSQIENWEYQYDDNGNTVVKSRLTGAPTGGIPGGGTSGEYFWDEENRLILAKVNGMSTDYLYDASGTCTAKRGPGGETLYVSQFYQLQNRQRVTKHFFVGPTRVVSKLSHYSNPNGLYDSGYERKNIYTYHPDHLGSANYITDPGGKQFEHIEYTPYGETWIDDGTNLNIIDYRFTSKELDKHTGLYYFGARYLDPQSSRWLSPDPALPEYVPEMPLNDEARQRNGKLPGMGGVFNPLNMQLYHYAANNPLKYVDPNGKTPVFVYLYANALLTSPDLQTDMMLLANDWSSGDYVGVAGGFVGTAIPGLPAGTTRTAAKAAARFFNLAEGAAKTKTLFRGDRSSVIPDVVFKEGFTPKGTHSNLEQHVTSNTTAGNFISTTSEKGIAQQFAGKNGYVYEIETSNYIDVNSTLGARSPFPEQMEFSIPGGVDPSQIKGAWVMKNGVPTGEYIPNPGFKGVE